jgi:glycosyltransferase involved in cell wall biosynthesis
MKISYAITVCNEFVEIQRLITHLLRHKRVQDEIVVQMDLSLDDLNTQPEDKKQVFAYIMKHQDLGHIRVVLHPLNNNFSKFKNNLTNNCTGDYIINIDADEIPAEGFMANIIELLEENDMIDVFVVPRWNTVEGLTDAHIAQWRWNVDTLGRINWPDYQMRVYKRASHIIWTNAVHEVLNGFNTFAPLPDEMYFHHDKTIDRQEKQNQYYSTI